MKRPATLKRKLRLKRSGPALRLHKGEKREVRAQFAALCWRRSANGKIKICLVTSRRSKRWILPKGWPMPDRTPSQAAEIEAWEEAGLAGTVSSNCLGVYSDRKDLRPRSLPVVVMVYPMEVTEEYKNWPEMRQRKRQWIGRKRAASLLAQPELASLVRNFDPDAAT